MITTREFIRNYLFKVLLALIVIEIGIFAWMQKRNHRPEAVNDVISSFSGKEVKINVLKNDSDKDEDAIFIKECEISESAEISLEGNKLIVKINTDFVGTDSVKYTISDGKKEADAYLKFIVEENKPPVTGKDIINAYLGEAGIEIKALDNDTDAEGDSVFIKSFSKPLHGTVEKGDYLTYTPKKGFQGVDSFKYVVSDQFNHTNEATIIVNITNGKFSPISFFGNFANYTRLSNNRWEIKKDKNNPRIYLKEKARGNNGVLGEACLVKNRKYHGDLTITVKAKTGENLSENQWPDYAIIFSFQDQNNYSYAFINKNENASALLRCVNGQKEEIIKVKGKSPFKDNHYHDIKLTRLKNKVTVYVDGNKFLSAVNKNFSKPGMVGLGSANDINYFDDFNVVGKYK